MSLRWMIAAGLVLAAGGCAPYRIYPDAPPPRADLGPIAGGVIGANIARGDTVSGSVNPPLAYCVQDGSCTATPSRRQFLDPYLGRYYYYDARYGRYFWEDGQPIL